MDYRGIQKLKAFFSALKDSGFKQDLKQIPSFAMVDGQRTPVDKAYCLSLLRKFPQFQGDKFKDDNAIIKYLSDPINRKFLLGNFTTEQQTELTKVLEEKPVVAEAVSEQPTGQAEPVPTGQTVGESPASMTGGGIPQIPTIHNVPRVYRPQKPPEVKTYPKPPVIETGLDYEGKPYEVKETSGAKTRGRRFQTPKISGVTNFAKNFGSRAGVFFQRNAGKFLTAGRIGTAASTVIGGIAGSAFGSTGTFAGAIGGGILPSFIKSGGAGKFLARVGNGAINAGVGISNQVSRGGLNLAGPKKKIWLLFLGSFFLLVFGTAFLGALSPGGGSITGTGNVGIGSTAPGGSGNIASCLFTRSDQNPKSVVFRSQQLLSLFQEASQKSGVPVAVLAGIARIESPSIANFTDDNLSSYGCPTSETGAKGLMQVQPPGTTGSLQTGIALGAQYLGILVNQLNYCDLRQSIFLGAGVINVKRGGSWDPDKTNDKSYIDSVAETYYGCLRYGGPPKTACSDPRRVYSYGDDLFKSISECKPTGPVLADASCPIPEGKIGCASYGKVEPWGGFSGSCRPDSGGNGGHCNQNYVRDVGICGDVIRNGNLIRTAKSIDISNNSRAGDPVALPNINGKPVRWKYIGAVSAGGGIDTVITPGSSVPRDRPRYGWIKIFHSEGVDEGVWTLHLIHVEDNLPPIREGDILGSGLIGARLLNPWIRNDNWPHVHVTIGLNVGDSKNDLKDYDPGWKFADRELGMCAK